MTRLEAFVLGGLSMFVLVIGLLAYGTEHLLNYTHSFDPFDNRRRWP